MHLLCHFCCLSSSFSNAVGFIVQFFSSTSPPSATALPTSCASAVSSKSSMDLCFTLVQLLGILSNKPSGNTQRDSKQHCIMKVRESHSTSDFIPKRLFYCIARLAYPGPRSHHGPSYHFVDKKRKTLHQSRKVVQNSDMCDQPTDRCKRKKEGQLQFLCDGIGSWEHV